MRRRCSDDAASVRRDPARASARAPGVACSVPDRNLARITRTRGRKFKGNIAVRVPPEQHRELAMEAAEQNISLNRLISRKLSR
jgi:hypothetical protein